VEGLRRNFFGRQNLPGDLEHEGAERGGLGRLAGLGRPVILAGWKVDRQVRIRGLSGFCIQMIVRDVLEHLPVHQNVENGVMPC
jgi:hypothetical protein